MSRFALALLCLLGAASSAVPTAADATRVVASVLPIHSLTAAVMDGVGTPHLLVPPSTSPHGYELRPSDARALDDAELIVWMGGAFETYLERPIATLGDKAATLSLLEAKGLRLLPARRGGTWDDHVHDEAVGHATAGPIDPHAWLDPENALVMARTIAEALGQLDPANRPTYAANADRLKVLLEALSGELATTLAPAKDRPYIVFHDAYQYFETRFGVPASGSITVDPDRPPSARRLMELRQRIVDGGVVCVFGEPQTRSVLVQAMVEGTGVRYGELDPEGSLGLRPGKDAYPRLMHNLGKALVGCLG